ncbi:Rpn family recombination-promoting nuclease/putative transposase [Oceanirhabdus sp. W0125-5]|uniref:Rpn family recombination-promoting nuclease/putative transposase n=1 Tax=Oceanirhabdus sp. W0125-5 TaxID=2999116 RepID=UPI0022F32353|nr:Rpn family recombination-promoting nuclease/putative transposase [Oceanirhabdus sp. W0125-5]WBW95932.1 Rpn family recombination-promoting nuclease/putative transposase [Oceanirhabdus sp. W0125-5]
MKKDMRNIHDKSYKDLFSNKEVFIDLLKEMMKASWAKNIKPEDLILVNKSYITSDYEEKESDIVYKAKIGEKEVIYYILLEFQSSIDYRMPLRLLFYISEILRDDAKNAKHKAADKDLKIPAVIPIVLYNGKKKWDVAPTLRDMTVGGDIFGDNIIDFRYSLFDVNNNYSKEELIDNNNITSAIFLLDQKIDAEEAKKILDANKEEVERMVANNAYMLKEMKEKAEQKGREEEKIEIAKKLLDILDDETISQKTGLEIEKIKELRNK